MKFADPNRLERYEKITQIKKKQIFYEPAYLRHGYGGVAWGIDPTGLLEKSCSLPVSESRKAVEM